MSANKNGINTGDISAIRDILMGKQIQEYDDKINDLSKQIITLRKELSEKSSIIEKKHERDLSNLAAQLKKQIEDLGLKLESSVSFLESSINKSSLEDKNEVGKLLVEIGNKLIKE